MSDERGKIASRLLSTEFSAWNDPRRAKRLLPVFVVAGGGIGILLQSNGVATDLPLPVLWTIVTLFGYVVLALVD
jgi:hypothetical protein